MILNGSPTPLFSVSEKKSLWLIGVSLLIVGVVLAVLIVFDAQHYVIDLLRWFDSGGSLATLLFVLVMVAVNFFLLPGVLFTCGAGFFWVVEGSVYVVCGTTIGASISFLISRFLLGERAANYIRGHTKLNLLSEELGIHGGKIVFLTRLIPFSPSELANYFFGFTPVSFRGFAIASLFGFIPYSVHSVYLGPIVADITLLTEGSIRRTPLEWSFYAGGFVVTIVILIYFNHLARRALSKYVEQ